MHQRETASRIEIVSGHGRTAVNARQRLRPAHAAGPAPIQPSAARLELMITLKTAKALGLAIPESLLLFERVMAACYVQDNSTGYWRRRVRGVKLFTRILLVWL